MALYFYITLISLIIHFVLIVPFINFLYRKKIQRADQKTKDVFNKPTPIFDSLHKHKRGTPVGGGILVLTVTSILTLFFIGSLRFFDIYTHTNYPSILLELAIILFTFFSYGLLGLFDDLKKIFVWEKKQFFGIRLHVKLIIEILLALVISSALYFGLQISIVHVPFLGVFDLSFYYIFFASFVIVSFVNAVNITDGLDGLASGMLLIALMSFWTVAHTIIDVPLSIFIAVWIGGMLAFLYFNIYPARIFLGDTGALSFGAAFAVIGLILGKAFALPIIGGIFVLEIASSLIQLLSKKYLGRKVFAAAPLHLLLQHKGWEEPKIVMRFWVFSIICALFGLMIAFLK